MSGLLPPSDRTAQEYTRQIREIEDAVSAERKQNHDREERRISRLQESQERDLRRKDTEIEDTVNLMRDRNREASEQSRNAQNQEIERLTRSTYDRAGRLGSELSSEQNRANNAVHEVQSESQRRLHTTEEKNDVLAAGRERAYADKMSHEANVLHDAHQQEEASLRKTIKGFESYPETYRNGAAQGRQDAIHDLEADWRLKAQNQATAYDKTLGDMKRHHARAESAINNRSDEVLHAKDQAFTKQIAQQESEHHQATQELGQVFEKNRKELELRNTLDRAQANVALDHQGQKSEELRQTSLLDQARNYQSTMDRENSSHKLELSRQHDRLLAGYSNGKSKESVSPVVEEHLRSQIAEKYERERVAETGRNRGDLDTAQARFNQSLTHERQAAQVKATKMAQDTALERTQSDTRFTNTVADQETQRKESLRALESQHDRQDRLSMQSHSSALEHQRQEYEEIIRNLQFDAQAKRAAILQDSEFSAQLAQRTFSAKQNELIRESERKLADQRTEFEVAFADAKNKHEILLKDSERSGKVALEEQAKGYEQRMALQEYQSKERERLIAQNYQDELEKTKRSNALLIHKKS